MFSVIRRGARELVAVYFSEESLETLALVKRWGRWRRAFRGTGYGLEKKIIGAGLRGLEEFLKDLPVSRDRRIHIGMPRDKVFVRDVVLPPMALEDALEAVRNAFGVHCHLPLNEVFVDVRLHRLRDASVQATVVYTPKKNVEGILSVVSETGHAQELQGIFPASFGWLSWFRRLGMDAPAAVVVPDGEWTEVFAVGPESRVHSWLLSRNPEEPFSVSEIMGKLQQAEIPPDRVFFVDGFQGQSLPAMEDSKSEWPHPLKNRAGLTAAVALDGRFDFCLNGSPPKIRVLHPAKVVLPCMVVLALTGWGLKAENDRKMQKLERKIERTMATIQSLEQQLEPMKKNVEEMQRVRTLLAGAEGFMGQRPKFFSFFNDLATRSPDGTWVSNVRYDQNQFVLQMVTPDSLKFLEGLRASPLIRDVQIRGAVNRRPDGKETFQVVVELKK